MFCSHCGKKVEEDMLFCPYCGVPLSVRDADKPSDAAAPAMDSAGSAFEGDSARKPAASLFDDDAVMDDLPDLDSVPAALPEKDEEEPDELPPFKPLRLGGEEEPAEDDSWRADIARKKTEQREQRERREAERRTVGEPAVKLEKGAPRLDGGASGGNLFMDEEDDYDAADGYDAYDDEGGDGFEDFDEEDDEGFFMRHIRSFVALILCVILAVLVLIYILSEPGQQALARMNLAWRPELYADMGYQYYQSGDYADAGVYYERALSRDADNYDYAQSAVACYKEAGNITKAADMLRRCIDIRPNEVVPYKVLLELYPDAKKRPQEITQLIHQGYNLTGDESLKTDDAYIEEN